MGGQRQAAWRPGCVVRVRWSELEALSRLAGAQSWLAFERFPEKVREILGEPRAGYLLADCRARLQPQLVPTPEEEL